MCILITPLGVNQLQETNYIFIDLKNKQTKKATANVYHSILHQHIDCYCTSDFKLLVINSLSLRRLWLYRTLAGIKSTPWISTPIRALGHGHPITLTTNLCGPLTDR